MAIALVRAGSLATASAASVTPAYGQATTAANLAVARVYAQATSGLDITTGITTSSSGWVIAKVILNSTSEAAVAYKKNIGASESAPTFTCTGATTMGADLLEFSGADTTSPLDQTGTAANSGSPTTVAATAADTAAGNVAVCAFSMQNSKSATFTASDSWTPSGGSVANAQGNGGTKGTVFFWGSSYITTGNGSADTDAATITPSSGALAFLRAAIATFAPASGAPPAAASLIFQSHRLNPALRR